MKVPVYYKGHKIQLLCACALFNEPGKMQYDYGYNIDSDHYAVVISVKGDIDYDRLQCLCT